MLDGVKDFKPALMPQSQFVVGADSSADLPTKPGAEVGNGKSSNLPAETMQLVHTLHATNRMRDTLFPVQNALDMGLLPDADMLDDKDLAAHQLKTNLSALSASGVKVPAHARSLLSSFPQMARLAPPLAKEDVREFAEGRKASLFSDVELWGRFTMALIV
ncbi:hypothetical protein [Chromobacterium vaccinii]|uniref:hypothetical protein n=1 Tax=Chromobacterium vaccinii TaxID=1108595 RepID=UPI0011C01FEF|nr:hypothetical protein [Chromobacterium vaccinii]